MIRKLFFVIFENQEEKDMIVDRKESDDTGFYFRQLLKRPQGVFGFGVRDAFDAAVAEMAGGGSSSFTPDSSPPGKKRLPLLWQQSRSGTGVA